MYLGHWPSVFSLDFCQFSSISCVSGVLACFQSLSLSSLFKDWKKKYVEKEKKKKKYVDYVQKLEKK